jgi:hypothetical protein
MKPTLGWTMLSREEMRQVERSLANGEQETRDEIGFLLIHQAFADRFFPGTSVLHTRVRYVLFIPWLYLLAASSPRRGSDIDAAIRRQLIQLAIRLKQFGGERYDVIGGDKLGQLTSQPPDRVYWTALRGWGLLLPSVISRAEVLRRLQAGARGVTLDDDGGALDDVATEVFAGLPAPPADWNNPQSALHFKMPISERDYLRRKLGLVRRPGDGAQSLLARLVESRDLFQGKSSELPHKLDARADTEDKRALGVARDAAALSAIGRTVYGALVEQLRGLDGGADDGIYRAQLGPYFATYGEAAGRCNLDVLEAFIPELPLHVRNVLRETRAYVQNEKPEDFAMLQASYQKAEVTRKTGRRARLLDTERSAERRSEWDSGRHNTKPLHYRWDIVRDMLADLSGP